MRKVTGLRKIDSKRRRKLKLEISERHNNICFWCDRQVTSLCSTLDHIVPTSKGGSNHIDNLVLACYPCNNKRGDEDAESFLRKNSNTFSFDHTASLTSFKGVLGEILPDNS